MQPAHSHSDREHKQPSGKTLFNKLKASICIFFIWRWGNSYFYEELRTMWFVSSWFHPVSWSDLWNEQVWWLMGKKTCSLSALQCTSLAVSIQFSFSYALKVRSVPHMSVRNPTIPFEQALTLNNTNVVKLFTTSILIVLTQQLMMDWGSNFTLSHSPENFNHWNDSALVNIVMTSNRISAKINGKIQLNSEVLQIHSHRIHSGSLHCFLLPARPCFGLCFSWRAKSK